MSRVMKEACIFFYRSAVDEQTGAPPLRTVFKFYQNVNDLIQYCEGYSAGCRLPYYSIVFD